MRIAIFHNFLDNIGGAEIVTLHLARAFEADIYTTNIDVSKIEQMGFSDLLAHIYSLGKIPKVAPFRQQLALFKFRRLNLKGKYDFFIIAGDWAMSGAVNNHPNLWYVHSPLNELWAFTDFIKKQVIQPYKRPFYEIWLRLNRYLTRRYAKAVDNWVCNSNNTKERIKRFYQKEARVIYPPVVCPIEPPLTHGNYWLSVNRLITHKRVELQLEALALLPEEKLIIVGSYEKGVNQFETYRKRLERIKPQNVTIKHWVGTKELESLYASCKGFIATATQEDFGLTVVEAMAQGKPVVAPKEGGYIESIISGKTGLLIEDISGKKLADAMQAVSDELAKNPNYYRLACYERAKEFDLSVFVDRIKRIVYE